MCEMASEKAEKVPPSKTTSESSKDTLQRETEDGEISDSEEETFSNFSDVSEGTSVGAEVAKQVKDGEFLLENQLELKFDLPMPVPAMAPSTKPGSAAGTYSSRLSNDNDEEEKECQCLDNNDDDDEEALAEELGLRLQALRTLPEVKEDGVSLMSGRSSDSLGGDFYAEMIELLDEAREAAANEPPLVVLDDSDEETLDVIMAGGKSKEVAEANFSSMVEKFRRLRQKKLATRSSEEDRYSPTESPLIEENIVVSELPAGGFVSGASSPRTDCPSPPLLSPPKDVVKQEPEEMDLVSEDEAEMQFFRDQSQLNEAFKKSVVDEGGKTHPANEGQQDFNDDSERYEAFLKAVIESSPSAAKRPDVDKASLAEEPKRQRLMSETDEDVDKLRASILSAMHKKKAQSDKEQQAGEHSTLISKKETASNAVNKQQIPSVNSQSKAQEDEEPASKITTPAKITAKTNELEHGAQGNTATVDKKSGEQVQSTAVVKVLAKKPPVLKATTANAQHLKLPASNAVKASMTRAPGTKVTAKQAALAKTLLSKARGPKVLANKALAVTIPLKRVVDSGKDGNVLKNVAVTSRRASSSRLLRNSSKVSLAEKNLEVLKLKEESVRVKHFPNLVRPFIIPPDSSSDEDDAPEKATKKCAKNTEREEAFASSLDSFMRTVRQQFQVKPVDKTTHSSKKNHEKRKAVIKNLPKHQHEEYLRLTKILAERQNAKKTKNAQKPVVPDQPNSKKRLLAANVTKIHTDPFNPVKEQNSQKGTAKTTHSAKPPIPKDSSMIMKPFLDNTIEKVSSMKRANGMESSKDCMRSDKVDGDKKDDPDVNLTKEDGKNIDAIETGSDSDDDTSDSFDDDEVDGEEDADSLRKTLLESMGKKDKSPSHPKLPDLELKEAELSNVRKQVTSDLFKLSAQLSQLKSENDKKKNAEKYLADLKRKLAITEAHLSHKGDRIKEIRKVVLTSHKQISNRRKEMVRIEHECRSIGKQVHGNTYKAPQENSQQIKQKIALIQRNAREIHPAKQGIPKPAEQETSTLPSITPVPNGDNSAFATLDPKESSAEALQHFRQLRENNDHKIDPLKEFCRFELQGKCNDDQCQYQHSQPKPKPNASSSKSEDALS